MNPIKPYAIIDLETDVNEAIVRWPYGGTSVWGSRCGRERYAKMFAEVVERDLATTRLLVLAKECATWHLDDRDDDGEIARELYALAEGRLNNQSHYAHLDS